MTRKTGNLNLKSAARVTLSCVAALLVVGALNSQLTAEGTTVRSAEKVDQTRQYLEKWVETQRVISQEKRDLALPKEMLSERIALLEGEIKSLREKISQSKASIAEADKKRQALVEENTKLKTASEALKDTVIKLENLTRHLLQRLPDPIRQRVRPLSQRFPHKQTEVVPAVGERFQNVVGILNEVNKFNREISVTSEVRTLADGTSAEVTVMYIGIGKAYYVSANKAIAGVGSASADGWMWTPANNVADQIADAIAILKNEKIATFVQLPIEIK